METTFNLRSSFQDRQIDYVAALRDEAIMSTYGIPVSIKVPKQENNLDEYINYTDKNREDFYYQETFIVPKFKEYRQILSQYGNTAEENYCLECTIPSALHLPRNSRVILNEYDSNENKVAREWRVLSTTTKQLSNSKSYTRIANLVPDRTSILNASRVPEVNCTLVFSNISDYIIYKPNELSTNYITHLIWDPINTNSNRINNITASTVCNLYWTVRMPSILY